MADGLERIEAIRSEARSAIEAATGTAELEELRVRYLGRKSELTAILRGIADLPAEERGPVGAGANKARQSWRPCWSPAPRRSTPRAGVSGWSKTGSTSPCPAPRPGRSATPT